MSCIVDELVDALGKAKRVIAIAADQIKPEYRGKNNIYDETIEEIRTLIKQAREHDCIPVGDAKEVAEGTRW